MTLKNSFREKLNRELAQVRKETDAAIGEGGDMAAGIRAALDHGLAALPGDFAILRALGYEIDGTSYFLGSQLAALAFSEVDPMEALNHPIMAQLLKEYAEKAGKL